MTEQEVLDFGKEKIEELVDVQKYGQWKIRIDRRSYRRLGCCKFSKKEISVSAMYIAQFLKQDIKDTVLHEIAHVLAGPGQNHNWIWKQCCRKIGAHPQRCSKAVRVVLPKGHKLVCEGCGKIWIQKRKPKIEYIHRKCPGSRTYSSIKYVGYVDNTKDNSSIKIAAQISNPKVQRTNRKQLCRDLVGGNLLDSYIIDVISKLYIAEGKTVQYGVQRANCVLKDVKKEYKEAAEHGKRLLEKKPKFKLTSDWCKCKNFEFYSYPEDG